MNKLASAALAVCLLAGTAAAQQVPVRDEAAVDVPRSVFGSGPSDEVRREARRQAVDNAWRRYQAQNASGARAAFFAQHAAQMRQVAEEACTFQFYDEHHDKDAGRFSVRVRGSCDQRAIDAAVQRLAGGGAAPAAGGGAKPAITFVFLARRAADSTTFEDRTTLTRSATAGTGAAESSSESSRGSGSTSSTSSEEAGTVTRSLTVQAKGTVDRRDTVYKYKVEQSEGADNAVTNVLTTAGFEVARYSDVLGECPGVSLDEIVVNFADPKPNQAEFVAAELRRRMIASARKCEMALFAVGLLDILKAERMPDGTERVTVALTVDVRDIRRTVPTAVAAIPAAQFQAIGRDRIEAANSALRLAAERGTREVVDMLRQRGFQ
jgi:hypothetical protein